MRTIVTELPLFDSSNYKYSFNLEGETFTLSFLWLDRTAGWYFSVEKADKQPVLTNVRLVENYPIIVDYALREQGLSGFFTLVSAYDFPSNNLKKGPRNLAKHYRFFYAYQVED